MNSLWAFFFCGFVAAVAGVGMMITVILSSASVGVDKWDNAPLGPVELFLVGFLGLIFGISVMTLAQLSERN